MNEFIDKFAALPPAQRVMLLIVLMALIGVAVYMFVLSPMDARIAAANQQANKLQREMQSLEELKRNRTRVVAQLEKLQTELSVAQEKLPKGAEIPSLLQRIHSKATAAGLTIEKFQRQPDTPKDFYVEIPVAMELRGTYDELANFFNYVRQMTRIVNVRDIQMKRIDNSLEGDGELDVKALATTFRYKSASENAPKKGKK